MQATRAPLPEGYAGLVKSVGKLHSMGAPARASRQKLSCTRAGVIKRACPRCVFASGPPARQNLGVQGGAPLCSPALGKGHARDVQCDGLQRS